MKSSLCMTALAASLSFACLSPDAHANDTKGLTVFNCFASNPAQQGDLYFSTAGVKNNAATARIITCPLIRDQEGGIDEGSPTSLGPWYKIGPSGPGSVSCTAYHGSGTSGGFVTASNSSGVRAANYSGFLNITLESTPASWSQVQIVLSCSVGPGVTLNHFYLQEPDATETGLL